MTEHTVITSIYAPNNRMEKLVIPCLKSIGAEFPHDRRIAGIDAATPAVEKHCRAHGWEIVRMNSGAPPRMGSILGKAVAMAESKYIWTVEHDVEVLPGRRAGLRAKLEDHPRYAGVEAVTLSGSLRLGYPCNRKRLAEVDDPALRDPQPHASLNCVCWRADALKELPWHAVPDYPNCDQVLSRLLRRRGWRLRVAMDEPVIHRFAGARKDLDGPVRRGGARPHPKTVDLVTVTKGRPTLDQAILAGLRQTYPHTRVVVVSDGHSDDNWRTFRRMTAGSPAIYAEIPGPSGSGDAGKNYWMNRKDAAGWIWFLDDDDWIPPYAVAEMVNRLGPKDVAVTCKMLVVRREGEGGSVTRYRMATGELKNSQVGCGSILFRKNAAKGLRFKPVPTRDFAWIQQLAQRGTVAQHPVPLVFYNAYRSDAERMKELRG